MNHTPGPWVVGAHPEEDVYQILAPEQPKHETVIAAEVHEGANARLIAAAPELLAACEAALSYWADPSHQRSLTGLVSLLANAIAKAHAVGAHAPHWEVQP